jgi:class 3 adenylate cyclase/tetratricopeptide (TPR) repeat protein
MQCFRCRAENDPQNAFCGACGASLQLVCNACGLGNRQDSLFCTHCGGRLDRATSPSLTSNQLFRALSVSGGEYKRLTVLFADIRDSTSLIDSLRDPELGMRRLEPVLAVMKEAVHRYDGVVNKVQGDGVMALFGAPRPHEDHAVRGCLAALAMQTAVTRLGDPGLQIRVGLNTGEVVVQVVDNSIYQTYDAAGVSVHLANRMEQMADGSSILITGDTYAAARQFVEVAPLGMRTVRGISAPVEVFKLTGLLNAPASGAFRSEKRLTSLTGRSEQLAALELELTHALEGDGRVVGIVGEAGLGKSRICFEFAETCRRRGLRVYEARVLSHGRSIPFQPVQELLRDALSIRPSDKVEVSRQRVTAQLRQRGDFSESLPLVLDFLGLQDPAHPPSKLEPTARKHRLLSFVRQLIHSRLEDEAVLVVLEDLHWVDQASEEFVDAIVDAIVGTKTMLLLNFRPGYSAPWMQRSHYRQIAIEPLPANESGELLGDLLGGDPSLALVARNIAERAQGNPFFLEELVRALAERGDFEGERGAYRVKAGIDAIPLPQTVQAVLGARIDQLPETPRQILQVASVIGRELQLAILHRVAGRSADEVAEALAQLRRAELLYELPRPDPGDHAFRHPLIQEVAYRSLLQGRRIELHRDVARALEQEFAAELDAYSGLIAFHHEQAGDLLPAVQALARSAMWLGAKDPSQAMRSWVKARELLSGQPRSEKTDFLRMMACGQIVSYGWREGLPAEDARPLFEEADEVARGQKNKRASALLHAGFGRILAVRGSADEYVTKVNEALALAREANDRGLETMLKGGLAQALRLSGRLGEALEANIEAAARAHELSDWDRKIMGFDIEPWLTAMRGQLLIMLGRSEEARSYLDRVIQMDPNDINVADHVVPSLSYVDLAWVEHDIPLAEQHAERAFSMAVRSGNPYLRAYATACRGLAHIVAGRPAAAVEDLTTAIDFARRRKAGLEYEPKMLTDLASALYLKGDLDAALRAADEAVAVCVARRARATEALAHVVRARVLLASSADGAEDELARAKSLLADTGAKIYSPLIEDIEADLADPGETSGRRSGGRRS